LRRSWLLLQLYSSRLASSSTELFRNNILTIINDNTGEAQQSFDFREGIDNGVWI
jgi:hypothetical protein